MNLNKKFYNVELHTHLDGSMKPKTILDVAKKRNKPFKFKTEIEIKEYLSLKNSRCLRDFLEPFIYLVPFFSGDNEAIYQLSLDFIEQCSEAKICYVESRFSPHILSSTTFSTEDVIKTVLEGFEMGRKQYGVESRIILAGLREMAEETHDLIQLAKFYKNYGVVGIDIAGDEQTSIDNGGTHKLMVKTFQEAEKEGIHRTVHAGENGPAASVYEAVVELHAERLGHGYRVLNDPKMYQDLIKKNIHFEVCPSSSLLTGAVDNTKLDQHPIIQFARDNVNFSINTDDVMITGRNLIEEQQFVQSTFKLTPKQIHHARLSAAQSAFLDPQLKSELVSHVNQYSK